MFLIVEEDGCLSKASELTNDLRAAADAGIVELVDLTTGTEPLWLVGDDWLPLPEYKQVNFIV